MTPQEWASTLQAYLLLGVTAWGVYVASTGLHTWKKQLKGGEEWRLARRFLRNVLRLRDALAVTPLPLVTAAEMIAAQEALGIEDSRERGIRIEVSNDSLISAYQVRWRRVVDAHSDYRVDELESEVLWGASATDATAPLNKVVQDVRSQKDLHIWALHEGHSGPRDKRSETVFTSSERRKEFESQLEAAVAKAEAFARQKLER